MLNTSQYLEARREAYKNDKLPIPNSGTTPATNNYDLTVWDSTDYTDWQKIFIGGTSHYTDAQASLSGGNSSIQYLVGANYHNQTTVFPGDFSNKRIYAL